MWWSQSRPIFVHSRESIGHVQLLDVSDERLRVCVGGGRSRPRCTFHLLVVWRGPGCTGRGEVDRHLIRCYLLLRPGCYVVCLTLVKSSGLIKPTVQQARAHKRDDESGEWSGLWWILALSCTGRGGGLRPAYRDRLAVWGWNSQWAARADCTDITMQHTHIKQVNGYWCGRVRCLTCNCKVWGLNLA